MPLQILDFMTTRVGLRMLGLELGPFIGWLMREGDSLGELRIRRRGAVERVQNSAGGDSSGMNLRFLARLFSQNIAPGDL